MRRFRAFVNVERREDGLWFDLGEGKTEAAERSVPIQEAMGKLDYGAEIMAAIEALSPQQIGS